MGGIFFHAGAYVGTLSELAGYKAGLAVTRERMRRVLRSDKRTIHPWPRQGSGIHLRSEEFEDAARWLLFKLGATRTPSGFAPMEWQMKMEQDPATAAIAGDILQWQLDCTRETALQWPGQPIDLTPMFGKAAAKYGREGLRLAQEYYAVLQDYIQGAPFSAGRVRTWDDVVDLERLFRSPDAPPTNGDFIEQRFVDYLAANLDDVDSMYWRQLERLTAEYLSREGFRVELGPGANDDGVDVRAWRDHNAETPTIVVQCKRQRKAVPKVVVKSLWADVQHESGECQESCRLTGIRVRALRHRARD